jgi:hypothetical protein
MIAAVTVAREPPITCGTVLSIRSAGGAQDGIFCRADRRACAALAATRAADYEPHDDEDRLIRQIEHTHTCMLTPTASAWRSSKPGFCSRLLRPLAVGQRQPRPRYGTHWQ